MEANKTIDILIDEARDLEEDTFIVNEGAVGSEMKFLKASVFEGLGIKLLSIIGGFLACSFFLGFVFAAGLLRSEDGMLAFGLVLVALTIIMSMVTDHRFFDGAAVALMISGLSLTGAGLGVESAEVMTLVFMGIALISFVLVKNKMLLFLSVLIFNLSPVFYSVLPHKSGLILPIVFFISVGYILVSIGEPCFITASKKLNQKYTALRAGFLFSFLILLAVMMHGGRIWNVISRHWLTWIIFMLEILIVLHFVFRHLELDSQKRLFLFLSVIVLLLPLLHVAAVPGAFMVLMLSVFTRNRTGFACGIISFVYFISRFYYDLNKTLLEKSMLLLVTGSLFLLLWFFVKKMFRNEEV